MNQDIAQTADRRVAHRVLPGLALALVVAGGAAHGLLTARWEPPDVDHIRAALDAVPFTVDQWDGTPVEIDPESLPAEAEGVALVRRYVHRTDRSAVLLYLTAGRPGPIVAGHHPDSCYPGAGFAFSTPMETRAIPAGQNSPAQSFRAATFSKTSRAAPIHVRVFWAWSADGTWRVPDAPRVEFARYNRLYKMYVIRQLPRPDELLDTEPAVRFIQQVTPELQKVLFAGR